LLAEGSEKLFLANEVRWKSTWLCNSRFLTARF